MPRKTSSRRAPSRKNRILRPILLYLAETSKELAELTLQVIFDPRGLIKETLYPRHYSVEQIRQAEYRLKRSQYVQGRRDGTYALTSLGRAYALRLLIGKKLSAVARDWNGKWLVVIFDVPELSRRDRRLLRNELKILGFLELQKSVWIIPIDIERELLAFLALWRRELAGDVRILTVDRMRGDGDIRRKFHLR